MEEFIDISDEVVTDTFAGIRKVSGLQVKMNYKFVMTPCPSENTQKPSTIKTKSEIQLVVANYDDDSAEKELTYNDVTSVYLKHFPYTAVNTGVSAAVWGIDEIISI